MMSLHYIAFVKIRQPTSYLTFFRKIHFHEKIAKINPFNWESNSFFLRMDDKDEDEEEQMVDIAMAVIDQTNDCSLIFSDSPSFSEVSDRKRS